MYNFSKNITPNYKPGQNKIGHLFKIGIDAHLKSGMHALNNMLALMMREARCMWEALTSLK